MDASVKIAIKTDLRTITLTVERDHVFATIIERAVAVAGLNQYFDHVITLDGKAMPESTLPCAVAAVVVLLTLHCFACRPLDGGHAAAAVGRTAPVPDVLPSAAAPVLENRAARCVCAFLFSSCSSCCMTSFLCVAVPQAAAALRRASAF
jgi:hypothetical protein